MTEIDVQKARRIKADKALQEKVGFGSLDPALVEKCQEVIDNNDVDFSPLAKEYLDALGEAIELVRDGDLSMKEAVAEMTTPVMQLKANASLFGYRLIGNLANVMLSFLEGISALDEDVIAIVDAHHKTLSVIVLKEMKGDGGEFGAQMEKELKSVCQRYFVKRA